MQQSLSVLNGRFPECFIPRLVVFLGNSPFHALLNLKPAIILILELRAVFGIFDKVLRKSFSAQLKAIASLTDFKSKIIT